jgi:hypothetical protein
MTQTVVSVFFRLEDVRRAVHRNAGKSVQDYSESYRGSVTVTQYLSILSCNREDCTVCMYTQHCWLLYWPMSYKGFPSHRLRMYHQSLLDKSSRDLYHMWDKWSTLDSRRRDMHSLAHCWGILKRNTAKFLSKFKIRPHYRDTCFATAWKCECPS